MYQFGIIYTGEGDAMCAISFWADDISHAIEQFEDAVKDDDNTWQIQSITRGPNNA